MTTPDLNEIYVQYGCGKCVPTMWTNFDSSPTLRLEHLPVIGALLRARRGGGVFSATARYGDIVRGLPVPAGSCQGVYCSHVLEHLALEELRLALRHTYELLRAGGCFRLVVPDLEAMVAEYISNPARDMASTIFIGRLGLGRVTRSRRPSAALRDWLGGAHHLWMWDYAGLARELSAAGFQRVRRAQCGDGTDPRFKDVEDPARWVDSVGIEAWR